MSQINQALKAAGVKSASNRKIFIKTMPTLEALGINNDQRLAVFIGQLSHESAGFSRLEESLNYSAKRLMQVWPSRFPTSKAAKRFARNPKALANKVYNGRMGNATGSDDGWNYRGRGVLQITGANNYREAGYANNPDELKDLTNGLISAAEFFGDNLILSLCDSLGHKQITRKINSGYHGLKQRTKLTMKALATLRGGSPVVSFKPLRLGSRGARVKQIQRALGINDDGVFGRMTRVRVVNYQLHAGLITDGVVGEKTFALMMN